MMMPVMLACGRQYYPSSSVQSLLDEPASMDPFVGRAWAGAEVDEGVRYRFPARPHDAELEFLAVTGKGFRGGVLSTGPSK